MGTGPNFILDKGMQANGSTAYAVGEAVLIDTAVQSVKRGTTAAVAGDVVGVCMEAVDAAKLANTGKVTLRIRFLGIARVLCGANIAKGAAVTNNTSAAFVTQATAGGPVAGKALEAGTSGGYVEVLLTPGATL